MSDAARRRRRGEGTISGPRKDGRYVGAYYAATTAGTRKRCYVYGKSWEEAHEKLVEAKSKAHQGLPVSERSWKVGEYLNYWLEHVVRPNRRPATYALYEMSVRLYLKPGLGKRHLKRLSVAAAQAFLNQQLAAGRSVRNVHIMRQVLSSALGRAVREEILVRNVARLVELPSWERGHIRPWSADEAKRFLEAARGDPLYPAFLLMLLYGLRRGEALGLTWSHVDENEGIIRIRQQVQRVNGELIVGPVKTTAGRRELPLLPVAVHALKIRREQQDRDREHLGTAWPNTDLVFTTRTGRPVEPRNLHRSFKRICEDNGPRLISVHHLRHTVASLLKKLDVPARDAQMILGHSRITVTQEIYTHVDEEARRDALDKMNTLFTSSED